MIRTQPFDDKADVFAFGVFLMEWLTLGVIPFVRNKSTNYEFNFEDIRKFYPPDTPESIDRLSISCCNYFPQKRPTMKKVFQILELLYESVRLEGKHKIPPVPPKFSFDYDNKTKALLKEKKSKKEDEGEEDELSNPIQYLIKQQEREKSGVQSSSPSLPSKFQISPLLTKKESSSPTHSSSNNRTSSTQSPSHNNSNNSTNNSNNLKINSPKKKPLPKKRNSGDGVLQSVPVKPTKSKKVLKTIKSQGLKNTTLKEGEFQKMKPKLQRVHSGSSLDRFSCEPIPQNIQEQIEKNTNLEEKSTLSYKNPKNAPPTFEILKQTFKFSKKSSVFVQIKINNKSCCAGETVVFEVKVENKSDKKLESINFILRDHNFIKKDTGTFSTFISPPSNSKSSSSSSQNIFPVLPKSTKKFYILYKLPINLSPNNSSISQFYELNFGFVFKSTLRKLIKSFLVQLNIVALEKLFETNPNHVFGTPLSLVLLRENQSLPNLIVDSIQYFNNNIQHFRSALEESETTFGRGGKMDEVYLIRFLYDNGERLQSTHLKYISDPNSIIKALQTFLMMLPQPLFTFQLYPFFIQVFDNQQSNLKTSNQNLQKKSEKKNSSPYWNLFDKLSLQRKQIIAHLLNFFVQVTVSLDVTIEQISFTWAYPIFLKPEVIPQDTKEIMVTISKAQSILNDMLRDLSEKKYAFHSSLLAYAEKVEDPFF